MKPCDDNNRAGFYVGRAAQPRSKGFSQFRREKPWERGWGPLSRIILCYNVNGTVEFLTRNVSIGQFSSNAFAKNPNKNI